MYFLSMKIYIMEIVQESNKPTFLGHVFSTTEEDKGEMLNVIQYALLGAVPIVALNKFIQRFVPEADPDRSNLELLVEIVIQLLIIFIGIIVVHRIITYVPTYSGFKYENLTLTNAVLTFMVIVFSIQSKIGLKANILFDRLNEMWNGPSENFECEDKKESMKNKHQNSQADTFDNPALQENMFPPAPTAPRPEQPVDMMSMGPMAANSVVGGAFGSRF